MTDPIDITTAGGLFAFDPPPWLFDRAFTLSEAAGAFDVPYETLNQWARTLKLLGYPVHKLDGRRRLMTAHDVYVAAILAALYKAGIQCTPRLMVLAHLATRPDGEPRLPFLLEKAFLSESGSHPLATIEVDLSTIWIELEPKLSDMVQSDA